MILTDILSAERVNVVRGDSTFTDKDSALRALAALLSVGQGVRLSERDFHRVLCEREALQSTGIGDGVAIPHGAIDALTTQTAGVLICPDGIPFDAIDGRPVKIMFGVVGPKRATGEHLKVLARVSRLLRDPVFREKLLGASSRDEAYELIRCAEEGRAA